MNNPPKTSVLAGVLWAIFALIGSLPASPAIASERLDIDGFVKNYSSALDPPEIDNDPTGLFNQPVLGAVSNRFRINGRYRFSEWLDFQTSYDFVPRVQDGRLEASASLLTVLDPSTYRLVDLDHRLYPEEGETAGSFIITHNLDRAFATITAPGFDLYVGRQAIAWGSAHAVNPTDIIAPYTFNELDTEDRVGVDAIRLRVPLGFMGEIDCGYVSGEDFEWRRSAAFVRGKYYLWKTDISVMLVGFRENLMAGLDLTRAVGGAGVWFEGAQVFVGAFEDDKRTADEDYFRASAGVDYALGSEIYGFLEYHLNTAGQNQSDRYLSVLATTPYAEGSVYLMGRHYLAPGVTHQLTPLVSASGQVLMNLSDGSALLAPSVEYNIARNIYLSVGAFLGIGKGPEAVTEIGPGRLPLVVNSEFGLYSDVYFTAFRVYF